MLHELEEANALVVAVDVGRDLVPLPPPARRPAAARAAPRGARRGRADCTGSRPAGTPSTAHAVEAIRHAQLAGDWELARELLGRHWVHLLLDGEEATLGALLAGLPGEHVGADAELATIAAADLLERVALGRGRRADRGRAARAAASVPAARRHRAETALATVQLLARPPGRRRSSAVVDEASALLHGEGAPAGAELEAFALMNLGIAEGWTLRLADAEAHLEQALALGRRLGRPYVEIGCLGGARHGGEPDPPARPRRAARARGDRDRGARWAGRRSRSSASPS